MLKEFVRNQYKPNTDRSGERNYRESTSTEGYEPESSFEKDDQDNNNDNEVNESDHISRTLRPPINYGERSRYQSIKKVVHKSYGNCFSRDIRATDWWCNINCNHYPSHCPKNFCGCYKEIPSSISVS